MLSRDLIHQPTAEITARALLDADAFIVDFNRRFVWKSGVEAPVYTDCRRINLHPGARSLIKKALGTALRANFPDAEIAIGVAEAGVVWSAYAADEAWLRHAFVRKSVKQHGPQAGMAVECAPPKGLRAVVVDDLLASGKSVLDAIDRLKVEKDMEVLGVLTIVNWDLQIAKEAFAKAEIPMRALCSYPQILQEAKARGVITATQEEMLLEFYVNPKAYCWPPVVGQAVA
jgi:orotate phosphoribosyltransferase